MKIARFVFNPFGENTFIVWDETTLRAAIIDPGQSNPEEEKAVDDYITRNHLKLEYLIFTHLHIDHSFGTEHIRNTYGIGTSGSIKDAFLGLTRTEQARMFHLRMELPAVTIDNALKEGDVIDLGPDTKLRVIEVPGHSPGSIALYDEKNNLVLTGDALFPGSVGRTDIPGGNHEELIHSIKTKLMPLPDETVVIAGHSGETTIGKERRSNPFLNQ